jgi:hypothetical protein
MGHRLHQLHLREQGAVPQVRAGAQPVLATLTGIGSANVPPPPVDCLEEDGIRVHLEWTNGRTAGSGSRATCLVIVFKLPEAVAKKWRRLTGADYIRDVFDGVHGDRRWTGFGNPTIREPGYEVERRHFNRAIVYYETCAPRRSTILKCTGREPRRLPS